MLLRHLPADSALVREMQAKAEAAPNPDALPIPELRAELERRRMAPEVS